MDKNRSIEILKKCIDLVNSMSAKEFQESFKAKGLDIKNYDKYLYTGENFSIILPDEILKLETPTTYNDSKEFRVPFRFANKTPFHFYEHENAERISLSVGQEPNIKVA